MPPLRSDWSMAGDGEGLEEADDGGAREGVEGCWKRREEIKRKAAMAETRRRKRRLAMMSDPMIRVMVNGRGKDSCAQLW